MRLWYILARAAESEGLIVGGYTSKLDYSMLGKLVLILLSIFVRISTRLLKYPHSMVAEREF